MNQNCQCVWRFIVTLQNSSSISSIILRLRVIPCCLGVISDTTFLRRTVWAWGNHKFITNVCLQASYQAPGSSSRFCYSCKNMGTLRTINIYYIIPSMNNNVHQYTFTCAGNWNATRKMSKCHRFVVMYFYQLNQF